MKQYRVLKRGTSIIGYAKWDEPSKRRRHGLICDPIVPDENPMEVIVSVQAEISTLRAWQTAEKSRYDKPLRSLGCILQPTKNVDMLKSFGQELDLTNIPRTLL